MAPNEPPPRPRIPLRSSDLLVNGPRDLRIGAELERELASADRVDLLVSFLKWSGVRVLDGALGAFARRRPGQLRVLTTAYLGATDPEALEHLRTLGARIRVSYDSRRTRLHAKAWLFHRESAFSTAFVGSSNLSAPAILDGLEWNVRLSEVDNHAILAKFRSAFEQYWDEGEFIDYDAEAFREAVGKERDDSALIASIQVRPFAHQQQILDALETERERGHVRNLVVAATGTGKTIVAALDYRRLRESQRDLSLLFVAHRKEILEQARHMFRVVLQDGSFGELLVGGRRPQDGRHVFAAIQSLHEDRLASLAPDAYDMVIVDEFHHAAAPTYDRLLTHLSPRFLLGLTATPERADGQSVLSWFDDRIAAELRLWTALDRGLLVPFQYFGVSDGTDLSHLTWRHALRGPRPRAAPARGALGGLRGALAAPRHPSGAARAARPPRLSAAQALRTPLRDQRGAAAHARDLQPRRDHGSVRRRAARGHLSAARPGRMVRALRERRPSLRDAREDRGQYSPTTLYEDYPMSPTEFHWESQNSTSSTSPVGRRYLDGASRVMLFARARRKDDRNVTLPYVMLGRARYVRHERERPMRIVWRLDRPMPPDWFGEVKLAAG